MKITKELTLETDTVLLRPLRASDATALFALAEEEEMWKYFKLNLSRAGHFREWMDTGLNEREKGAIFPFTIIMKEDNTVAGSMSYLNIVYNDLRLEIGSSWLGRPYRGTGVNLHSKYCLLRFAFEQLDFERVEFKTDVLNERAKNGLRKIGGKEEGIFRSHMAMWNDRRRDSIYFSILKNEWEQLLQTIFRDIKGYAFH